MKEKIFEVIKWVLIALGIIFLIQILIIIGAFIGISRLSKMTFDIPNADKIQKELRPIVDYAESYRDKNGKYPQNIENVKIKKDIDYKYEASKDFTCYTITAKTKKNSSTKQYQHCRQNSDNSQSSSESYVEFSN